MAEFYQPVIHTKKFFQLTANLVSELKSVFYVVQDEAIDLTKQAVRQKWTPGRLESKLVGLFEEDHTDVEIAKAAKKPVRAMEWAKLQNTYGNAKGKWSGDKYGGLIKKILVENQKKIAGSILEADRLRLEKNLKEMLPSKEDQTKPVKVPSIELAVKRSSSLLKAADNGNLMSQTRRDEIRKLIKRVLDANPIQTQTGALRKDISRKVENELKSYFDEYTKNSPPFGVPKNLHNIAVTETRSLVNNVRREYMEMADDEIDGYEARKSWKHNSSLSNKPRSNHKAMEAQPAIPLKEKFRLTGKNGKVYKVDGPHDYSLPPEEVITCNCEAEYTFVKIKKRPKSNPANARDMKDFIFDVVKQRNQLKIGFLKRIKKI